MPTGELAGILEQSAGGLIAIDGMAGVGKTTLAVHAARRLLGQGSSARPQIAVDPRGHDLDRPPADPAAVLDTVLRLLGVSGAELHGMDLGRRSLRYRELVAGRRALVLLDDAATEDQLRSLLPDDPDTVVLVTSRRRLSLPGARRIAMDVFAPPESLALLRHVAGADRVDAEPRTAGQQVSQVLGRCRTAPAGRRGWTPRRPEGQLVTSSRSTSM